MTAQNLPQFNPSGALNAVGNIGNLQTNVGMGASGNSNVAWNRDLFMQKLQMLYNMEATNNANAMQNFMTDKQNAFTQQQNLLQGAMNKYFTDLNQQNTVSNMKLQGAMTDYFNKNQVQNRVKDMIAAGVNPMIATAGSGSVLSNPASSIGGGSAASGSQMSLNGAPSPASKGMTLAISNGKGGATVNLSGGAKFLNDTVSGLAKVAGAVAAFL